MLYITQLIYLKAGQEQTFYEFEEIAIPLINQYNGRMLLRVRPPNEALIEGTMPPPFEIHLVEFDSEQDFENFKLDETRKKFLHLKEQSIQTVWMMKGHAEKIR
jgi:hypothetical protein